MTEENPKPPKSKNILPEIDLKPEDIYLEIDLETLDRWNGILRRAEDKAIDALTSLRVVRNQIFNIKVNDAKRVMKSNEEKITALEKDMSGSIEALKELEEKADIYKAGFVEAQDLLADKARKSETQTRLLNEETEDDEPCPN